MADRLSEDLASLRIAPAPRVDEPRRLRWLVGIGALGCAGVVGVVALPRLESAFFQAEVETTVVQSVSPATVGATLAASGYMIAQQVSNVGAKVMGKIADVAVREGQRVKKGELLLALDPADQHIALSAGRARAAAAEAEAARQRVQHSDAQRRLAREQALAAAGITGSAVVDDLGGEVRALAHALTAAESNVAAARAEVLALTLGLAHLDIRAPIDGTIVTKPPAQGEMVSPAGAPLLQLADFASLMLEVEVPESRLSKVRVGAPCEVTLDAYPAERHRGEVKEVSATVNRAKATVVVRVGFVGAAPEVLPNMAARAFFIEEASVEHIGQPPKTVVPSAAVVERAGATTVFVIDAGKVRKTPVVLGEAFGSGFELKEGPRVGTKLVKNPPTTLADGQRIKEKT
jgi:RND family efflux transporter MFP subunit